VPTDSAEAYFWLNLGASALDDRARLARDKAGDKLSPAKRLEIKERSRKWAQSHPAIHD
jgi:hypothetical protein